MDTVWKDICLHLQQRLASGQYKVWIAPLAGYRAEGEFVVHAVTKFVADTVQSEYQATIQEAVTAVLGERLPVRVTCEPLPKDRSRILDEADKSCTSHQAPIFILDSDGTQRHAEPAGSVPPLVQTPVTPWQPTAPLSVTQRTFDPQPGQPVDQFALPMGMPYPTITVRSWRHSFDDFVVGPCNELAFAASRSMCRENKGGNILFLTSAAGLGKTHLIQAAGRQLCLDCNRRMPRVEYLTAEEFTSQLVLSFKTHETDRFKARYRDVEVLLLEDVHFLQGKEKMQEELLATMKTLSERGSKVIFSSSFLPRELRDVSDQLLSRLSSGLLAVIDRPDRETRKRIFKEKAKSNQVPLPEDVSDFLADTIQSDVRQIESCLQNLILKAKILKTGITMQLAWEAVQHYSPCGKSLDLNNIIAYVSQGYGISAEQLRSKSRKRELVTARNTVFYLARKHTDLSLEEIGSAFNRSHATVIKGITNLEREMSRESSIGRQMASTIAIVERTGGIISPSL